MMRCCGNAVSAHLNIGVTCSMKYTALVSEWFELFSE